MRASGVSGAGVGVTAACDGFMPITVVPVGIYPGIKFVGNIAIVRASRAATLAVVSCIPQLTVRRITGIWWMSQLVLLWFGRDIYLFRCEHEGPLYSRDYCCEDRCYSIWMSLLRMRRDDVGFDLLCSSAQLWKYNSLYTSSTSSTSSYVIIPSTPLMS